MDDRRSSYYNSALTIIKRIAFPILLSVVVGLTISNLFFKGYFATSEHGFEVQPHNFLIYVIICVSAFIFFTIVYFLKISNRIVLIILLAYILITSVIYICSIPLNLYSDGWSIHNIAGALASHNPTDICDKLSGWYLGRFNYQIYSSVFLGIIYTFVGNSVYVLISLNVIAVLGIIYALYRITELLFNNNDITKFVLLLMFGAIPLIFYTTFFYFDLIMQAFTYFAILWLLKYFKSDKLLDLALSGIFIAFACLIKMNAIIFLIGMVLMFFAYFLENKKNMKALTYIILLVIFLPTLGWGIKTATYTINNQSEPSTYVPNVAWVAMGLQNDRVVDDKGVRPAGWWNHYNFQGVCKVNESDCFTANDSAKSISNSIEQFVNHPDFAAWFFSQKLTSQWNDSTFIANPHTFNDSPGLNLAIFVSEVFWLMLLVFTSIYLIMKRLKINLIQIALALIIVGGFLFSIVWEAKSRYILPYYTLFFPFAAAGLNIAYGYALNLEQHVRQKGLRDSIIGAMKLPWKKLEKVGKKLENKEG